MIRLQNDKSTFEMDTRLHVSQLEDRLQAFSQSINMAESQRNNYEEQSFQDKTRITQLESKLSELTARTGIHQNEKERFVSDNERLKRELMQSKESYSAADSERYLLNNVRNELRNHLGKLEQTVSSLKMENARLDQALTAIRNEAGNSSQQARS